MSKNHAINASGVPEQNTDESLKGLDPGVRNLNNDAEESAKSNTGPWLSESMLRNPDLGNPAVPNADNQGLGEEFFGPFTVGYVDEVNGLGAEEVQGFVPTRHELIELAKYWAKVDLEIAWSCFCSMGNGGREIRLGPFAWRRVERIAALLGDVVYAAVDEVREDFGKSIDRREWNIFLNGTPEEKEAVQEEIYREIFGDQGAQPDSECKLPSPFPVGGWGSA
jgi:hypothetical protein